MIDLKKLADQVEADELGDWHRAGSDEVLAAIVKALRFAAATDENMEALNKEWRHEPK